jgi:tellurite resistance protein TehA-like permease
MATGIVSNAMRFEGHGGLSDLLFLFNLVAYPWLLLLTLARIVCFGNALWADLIDPRRVFSFFTIVAGSAMGICTDRLVRSHLLQFWADDVSGHERD